MAISRLTEAMICGKRFLSAGLDFIQNYLLGRSVNKRAILTDFFCRDPACQHPKFGPRLALAMFFWNLQQHDVVGPCRTIRIAAGDARWQTGSVPIFLEPFFSALLDCFRAAYGARALSWVDGDLKPMYMPYVESMVRVTVTDSNAIEPLAWEVVYPMQQNRRERVYRHVEAAVLRSVCHKPWNDTNLNEQACKPVITKGEFSFAQSLFSAAELLGVRDAGGKALPPLAMHTVDVLKAVKNSH